MRRLGFHVDGFKQQAAPLGKSSTHAFDTASHIGPRPIGRSLRQVFWLAFPLAMTCLVVTSSHAADRPKAPAKLAGSTVPFESPIQFVIDQSVQPIGRQLQGMMDRPIKLPAKGGVSRSSTPVKQITLLGGDHITAEIQRWDRQEDVELRLPGGQVARLPRSAIKSVSNPRGESEVLYEPFEEASAPVATAALLRPRIDAAWIDHADVAGGRGALSLAPLEKPLTYEFPRPIDAGRVQIWFRIDSATPTNLSAEFDVGSDRTSPCIVKMNAATASVAPGKSHAAVTTQTVALSRGWHCLTALLFAEHAVITIDDSLLLSASQSLGPLHAIRFSATGPALLDDLQVSRFSSAPVEALTRPTAKDDCVSLSDGDQWFGNVSQINSTGVVISDPTGDRVAAWPQVVGVALHQSESTVPQSMSTSGLQAVVELQGNLDRPQQYADRIHATIVHVERDYMIVAHPWLGRLALGWNQIARIEPQYVGRSLTLDARSQHLGDAIREDFQRQLPDGLDWTVKFPLASPLHLLPAEVWLTMDVVDLEPSGPQTPPASKFLKELRSGQLLTQITINNQPAGDLNRWIRFRATPDSPERIRCLLPAGLLQAGENSLRLHQIPLKTLGRHYDNCELSNLRLEFVEPLR